MTRDEYKAERDSLLDQAQTLIDDGKVGEANAKAQEVRDLDAKFETEAKAAANARALSGASGVGFMGLASHSVQVDGATVERADFGNMKKEDNKMKNATEIQAFQKYIALGGDMRTMSDDLRNSITTSGAGAVLPEDIFQRMITEDKYSDLLHRATIINQGGAGTIKIPVASHGGATWKAEGAPVTPSNPALTSIDLGGVELMRAIQYSAAVDNMSVENFADLMAGLVSSETVETLEKAFVAGSTADGHPHNGLNNLAWTANVNMVETASASTAITAADVAKGLSLLPQKYARNVVLLMNANTAYNTVGLFKGTNEYAYSMADGASRFMAREIIINEHCGDDVIYIVDPRELYVRFAMQPTLEVDRSSGFLSATTAMRCLAVVDYAWNPAACVKVGKKAA